MALRSAMRLKTASRFLSSRSISRPKSRKAACTSFGGLAVAMRLMKASGMDAPRGLPKPNAVPGRAPAFYYNCRRAVFSPGSALPEMHPVLGGEIVFLPRLHIKGAIPGIHVAGGADHPELRHSMLIRHGL